MKVRLWRWDEDAWTYRGETVGVSTGSLPTTMAMMHVPHDPLWYGYEPAPPSSRSASDKPPPHYKVPRR